MILRIEDTDQGRYVPGAEQYIIDALTWAGITIDEGVSKGGPHAPYRQSERKPIYKQYAQQLIDHGRAYYAFDSAEELEAMRERLKDVAGANPQYGSQTRLQMVNSLTLSADEVGKRLNAGAPYVIRLLVPGNEEIHLTDLIRGEVTVHSSTIDDKVLMKSDGMPTYHLANVVDDYLMKISHVIRGEEWLPSAPLHVLLYRYLGWEQDMPQFAHLPLLLKPDGNGKLSKRDADKMGFPIFPLNWTDPASGELAQGFRERGYLPDALINFLAFLGWNPGTEQELFSMDQLIQAFSIERIGKAGARFDIQKAQWFNQQYLKIKPDSDLTTGFMDSVVAGGHSCTPDKAAKIIHALKERVTFPQDFWEQGKIFFVAPTSYDGQLVAKKWNADVSKVLGVYADELERATVITAESAKALLESVALKLNIKAGQILQVLRMTITGGSSGPDLMSTLEILGNAESARRIRNAIQSIPLAS
jgi:glutamyl-tRNA synthetase